MTFGRTLFSQIMDLVPWTSFDRIVSRYGGDIRVRSLRCSEQFRIMTFAQMTYRESLRDIEACLGAQPSKLYGMGLREPVARSTLADANERRDWRIWADIAAVLIRRARKVYVDDDIGLDLANTVYALDSTTIDLCLSQLTQQIVGALLGRKRGIFVLVADEIVGQPSQETTRSHRISTPWRQ